MFILTHPRIVDLKGRIWHTDRTIVVSNQSNLKLPALAAIPESAPRPGAFETHGPQPSYQEDSQLVTPALERSTGALLGRSFLLGGPAGALIGMLTSVITLASTFLDPDMGIQLGDGRWIGLLGWLAAGGLLGAILGAVAGIIVGPLLVLLRIQRLAPVAAGILAIGSALLVRRLLFGLAWIDYDGARMLGDLVAAGLAAPAAYGIAKVALNLLNPKAALK